MILGIGTDITNQNRFAHLVSNSRFLNRILTPTEVLQLEEKVENRRVNFVSKRFAAKEAFSKALGVGIGGNFEGCNITFHSIEILHNSLGRPICNIPNAQLREKLGEIHISFADEGDLAVAFLIISLPLKI